MRLLKLAPRWPCSGTARALERGQDAAGLWNTAVHGGHGEIRNPQSLLLALHLRVTNRGAGLSLYVGLGKRSSGISRMINSQSDAQGPGKMPRIDCRIGTKRDPGLQAGYRASKLSYSKSCCKRHCISTDIFYFFRVWVLEFKVWLPSTEPALNSEVTAQCHRMIKYNHKIS